MNRGLIEKVKVAYNLLFGKTPTLLVRAPGRINLLGEHTDYNHGFVLPGAIDKAIYIAMGPTEGETCKVHAMDLSESDRFTSGPLEASEQHWANYIRGIYQAFLDKGAAMKGFNAVFVGDIPVGSGLSSSAALECGFGFAFNQLFHLGFSSLDIALAGQKAEHTFVGVKCGIMDQFASVHGKENHLIKLDCDALEYSLHAFPLNEHQLLLFNSGVSHELASSAYNERREQCETGLTLLMERFDSAKTWRDVSANMLQSLEEEMSPVVYRRCTYVIEENARVEAMISAMEDRDLLQVGGLMLETHRGLSEDYEVSCPEMDYLVELAKQQGEVLGARMMGGGFGGCTINLVNSAHVDQVIDFINEGYQRKYEKIPEVYQVRLTDGVALIN